MREGGGVEGRVCAGAGGGNARLKMPGKAFWAGDAKDFEALIKPLASIQVMAFPSLQLLATRVFQQRKKGKVERVKKGQLPAYSPGRGKTEGSGIDGPGVPTKNSGKMAKDGV